MYFSLPRFTFVLLASSAAACARSGATSIQQDAGPGSTGNNSMSNDAAHADDDAATPGDGDGQSDPDAGSSPGGGSCNATAGTCDKPWTLEWKQQGDGSYVATHVGATFKECSSVTPATCMGAGSGVSAREDVHQLEMPVAGTLSISLEAGGTNLGPNWSAAAYLLTSCGDATSLVACNGAAASSSPIMLAPTDTFAMGDTLFLYVDGADADARGSYKLTVTAKP